MRPYLPNFNITPASNMEPIKGASTWALGNQICKVYNGDLTRKDKHTNKQANSDNDEKPCLKLVANVTVNHRRGAEQTTVYRSKKSIALIFSGWYPSMRIKRQTGSRDNSYKTKKTNNEWVVTKSPTISKSVLTRKETREEG